MRSLREEGGLSHALIPDPAGGPFLVTVQNGDCPEVISGREVPLWEVVNQGAALTALRE